jgi:hypothetical protein
MRLVIADTSHPLSDSDRANRPEELAERFDVIVGWVFKISAALPKTGKMERQPGAKRGPVSKVTPEIESLIKEVIQGRSDNHARRTPVEAMGRTTVS